MPRRLSHYRKEFQETIDKIGNGLEKHLDTPIEFLSGGQRQALSLLMATLKRPELLLLTNIQQRWIQKLVLPLWS